MCIIGGVTEISSEAEQSIKLAIRICSTGIRSVAEGFKFKIQYCEKGYYVLPLL